MINFNFFTKINWFIFSVKVGSGSLKNGRDSNPKYRRIICFGGELVYPGFLLVTQCGQKFLCGKNCYLSRNYTIMSKVKGIVKHVKKKINNKNKIIINVIKLH